MSAVFTTYSSSLPTFYVNECPYDDEICTVTAYDRCKNLDVPFDSTNFPRKDAQGEIIKYQATSVISAIANQCGFSPSSPSTGMRELTNDDLEGKSCRTILEEISQAVGMYFYCDSSNCLNAANLPDLNSVTLTVQPQNRTKTNRTGTKTITNIYSQDGIKGETSGEGGSWINTVEISGRYMDIATNTALKAKILAAGSGGSYVYNGFDLPYAKVLSFYNLNDTYGESGEVFPMLDQTYRFDKDGINASFSAPAPDMSYFHYKSKQTREAEKKVEKGKAYSTVFVDENGSGVVIKIGTATS